MKYKVGDKLFSETITGNTLVIVEIKEILATSSVIRYAFTYLLNDPYSHLYPTGRHTKNEWNKCAERHFDLYYTPINNIRAMEILYD